MGQFGQKNKREFVFPDRILSDPHFTQLIENILNNNLLNTTKQHMDMKFEEIDFSLGINSLNHFEQSFFYPGMNHMNIEDEMDILLGFRSPQEIYNSNQNENVSVLSRKDSFQNESVGTEARSVNMNEQNLSQQNSNQIVSESQEMNRSGNNHHNFQKHTVTALRSLVSIQRLEELNQDTSSSLVLTSLWEQFLAIKGKKIMTKKFLFTLFSADKCLLKDLTEYGFQNLFKRFTLIEILSAQKALREVVYKIFTQKNIQEHVETRNLQRKEEFVNYLLEYREKQLKTGAIKKRMSKESSIKVTRRQA